MANLRNNLRRQFAKGLILENNVDAFTSETVAVMRSSLLATETSNVQI